MDMLITIVLSSVAVLVLFVEKTRGCGGHKLEVDYIRNCDSDNILELSDNFNVILTNDCDLHFQGCITLYNNVTKAEVDYTVQKDMMKYSGKKDGCNQLDNKLEDIELALNILGLPKQCPVYKGTKCMENKSINVSKHKLRMNVLAGYLKGRAVTTTDVGKFCVEFSAKLTNVLTNVLPTIGHGVMG